MTREDIIIESKEVSGRLRNLCRGYNIRTIGQLVDMTPHQLAYIRELNTKDIGEIDSIRYEIEHPDV